MRLALCVLLALLFGCSSPARYDTAAPTPTRQTPYTVSVDFINGRLECKPGSMLGTAYMEVEMDVHISPPANGLALIVIKGMLYEDGAPVRHYEGFPISSGKQGYDAVTGGTQGLNGQTTIRETFYSVVGASCSDTHKHAMQLSVDSVYTFDELEGNLGNMSLSNKVKNAMAELLSKRNSTRYAYKKRLLADETKWEYPLGTSDLPKADQVMD